ncbi:MAG: hypothetical protein KC423_11155 [Anaerolineales bacterium]|nr:hypothetical protein [Anaerolineales bacterium]
MSNHTNLKTSKVLKTFEVWQIFSVVLFTLALLLIFMPPAAAQEESDSGIEMSVRAGFDGYYKQEYWLPVHVTVANSGPGFSGSLQIKTGSELTNDEVIYSAPIDLPTQSNKRLTLYIFLNNLTERVTAELVDNNGRLRHTTPSNPMRNWSLQGRLYGVISPKPDEFTFLEDAINVDAGTAVAVLTFDDLPDLAAGWQPLDVLVINDSDSDTLTGDQRTALAQWVNNGGQLVVTGGPGWQKTTTALADLLPVTVSGSESRSDLPGLAEQVGIPFRDAGPYVVASSSLRSGGETIYHEDGLPLIARRSWGRGTVYFLALDPTLAPLLDWDGSNRLWADMARTQPGLQPWGLGVQNYYAAATAVSSLPSLVLPSFTGLIIFLLAYIALIGPINYLVLKRLQRRELAWITIPAIVAVFTIGTYLVGFQIKGNDTIINQMSVIYGQLGDGDTLTRQSLIGLYSPRRTTYSLTLPSSSTVRPINDGFTSLDNRFDSIGRSLNTTVNNIRTDVGGIKTFLAEGTTPAPPITAQAALALVENQLQLNVTLQNNSSIELEKAALLFGDAIIPLGTLSAGEEASIGQRIGQTSAERDAGLPILTPDRGARSPLSSSPEILLGTADYYNDPEAYPRWQLLQAIETSGGLFLNSTLATNVVTLIAWTAEPKLEVGLDRPFETLATTLYLLDIPVAQTTLAGQNLTVPFTFINWRVLDSQDVFEPSIRNLYLAGGQVDFEYQPRAEFAALHTTHLNIVLNNQDPATRQPPPNLSLWDWAQETWVPVEGVVWGETAVSNPTRFVSPANAARLRVEDASLLGVDIRDVYLVFTGNLE